MKVEKWGKWLFQRGGDLQIPFVLAALGLLRPQYPLGSHWFDELTDVVGYVMMLGGVGIRFSVIGYRKSGTSGRRGREIESAELITDGLYAHVRNPLYLGNLVIALGVMVIFLNPWLIVIFCGLVLHYYLIIRAEEGYLERKFGETYLSYKRSTPRLIPAIWRGKRRFPDRKFDWNEVVKREKDVILGVVLAPIALEIYEDVLYEGWRQFVRNDLGELMVYLTVAISAFLLWLVLRYQRKRRII
jgi:protein-S-isoprenylcysteine O-methyltransferase Ste14